MNQEQLKQSILEFKQYLETDELATENEELYQLFMDLITKWEKDPSQDNLQALVQAMELHEEMDREISDAHNQTSLTLLKQSENGKSLTKKLLGKYEQFIEKIKTLFNANDSTLTTPPVQHQAQPETITANNPTNTQKSEEDITKIIEQLKQLKG